MEQPQQPPESRSAEAAAVRWSLANDPDEDIVQHLPPSSPAEDQNIVPNRHSASAEAASLRWSEQHPDEEIDV